VRIPYEKAALRWMGERSRRSGLFGTRVPVGVPFSVDTWGLAAYRAKNVTEVHVVPEVG
jgi:hypothetical protein